MHQGQTAGQEPATRSPDVGKEDATVSSADGSTSEVEKPLNVISMFDPSVRSVVMGTVKATFKAVIGLSILNWLFLLLFYGAAWNTKSNYGSIQFAVADLDGDMIGKAVVAAATGPSVTFSVTVLSGAITMQSVMERVDAGEFHGALVANPNATRNLLNALAQPTATYTPGAATSFIFDEGRGGGAMASVLRSTIPQLATVLSNNAVADELFVRYPTSSIATLNPTALITPVGNTEVNLHRVAYSGETSAAGLGFIDNWVITMVSSSIVLAVTHSWDKAGIRKDHQIAVHMAAVVFITGFLAFWPPLLLLIFGSTLSAATVFRMWGYVWYSMIMFGAIVLSLFRHFGPARGAGFHGLFMLLNFIASPVLAPVELLYSPFLVSKALPFQNALEGSRTIIFGSYNVLGRNMGVMAGWMGIGAAVLFWHMRKEARAVAARAAAKAAGPEAAGGAVELVPSAEGLPGKVVRN